MTRPDNGGPVEFVDEPGQRRHRRRLPTTHAARSTASSGALHAESRGRTRTLGEQKYFRAAHIRATCTGGGRQLREALADLRADAGSAHRGVPFVVRWAKSVEVSRLLVAIARSPALPLLGFVSLTLLQQRRRMAETSFEAWPLTVSANVMSIWVLAGGVIGHWIILLAVAMGGCKSGNRWRPPPIIP